MATTKETFYFSHDYNSRNDPKMVSLIMKTGIIGVGIYWCVVEMLYEQGGYINLEECERIAFELRTDSDLVKSVIASELFSKNEKLFWSESVIKRLNVRKVKSAKARESVSYRWGNTNVERTKNDSNTIKESKGKKSKRNNGGVGEMNLPLRGVKFDGCKVFFPDDSWQELNLSQQSLLAMNELKPEDVLKK